MFFTCKIPQVRVCREFRSKSIYNSSTVRPVFFQVLCQTKYDFYKSTISWNGTGLSNIDVRLYGKRF